MQSNPETAATRRRNARYAADATLRLASRVMLDQMREDLKVVEYEIAKGRLRLGRLEAWAAAAKGDVANAE